MKIKKYTIRFSKKVLACLVALMLITVTAVLAENDSNEATYTTEGGTWVQVDDNTWTMDKDGDGITDITLIKKGDQWEYDFNVADKDADYYGWENEVPDGYQIVGKGERSNPVTNAAEKKYSHTSNVTDEGIQLENYANSQNINDVVTIPGAKKLHVQLTYGGEDSDFVSACSGKHPELDAKGVSNSRFVIYVSGVRKFTGAKRTVEFDVNGDSVTFGFSSDSSGVGNGYGYYAVVTSDVKGSLSITNQQDNYQELKYGGLKLSKVVSGNAAEKNQNFRFNIALSSNDTTISNKLKGNQVFGDVTFKDGQGTVYLKDGESVEMKNIPAGVTWKISEDAVDGYQTSINGGTVVANETNTTTGTISENQITGITYTNTKNSSSSSEAPTGSFKVKKVVKNGNNDDSFNFSASITGLKVKQDYKAEITNADNSKKTLIYTSNSSGIAYLDFDLKNKDTIKFLNLPIGSKYQIQENSSDYIASYEITDEDNASNLNAVMSKKENYEAKQELSTQKETLDENEHALITFTNSKQEVNKNAINIKVNKTWNDNDDEKKIRPSNIVVHLYQSTSSDEDGDMIATARLDKDNNWETVFENLDRYQKNSTKEYIYTVKEEAVPKYTSNITKSGNDFTIVNTLSNEKIGDLRISKTVEGKTADKDKNFKFKIKLEKDSKAIEGTYPLNSDQNKGTKTGSVYFNENGEAEISLKDGESAYITGLPEGTKYTVEENSYTNWSASLLDGTSWTGSINGDQLSEVKVKNTFENKHQLTLHKIVKGSLGDKSKDFNFEMTLDSPDSTSTLGSITYEKDGATGTIQGNDNKFKFTLSHNETIIFKDLPDNIQYSIKEVDGIKNGYSVTTDSSPASTLTKDEEITFTNTKDGTIPTLASMNTKILFICGFLAIIVIVALYFKRNKLTKMK
ncbi:MAG: DUF5979 domain-containing protein [Bacillota bacterium]|nr:DUF5979 domain-containing protein [Bacillota bacterium]